MRTETFELLIEELGQPSLIMPIEDNLIEKYHSNMPKLLIENWQQESFCQFKNGFYSIINPDEWQDVVDVWLENTPFQHLGNFYALARNAFGCIYIYNSNTGTQLRIDTIMGNISGSIKDYKDEFDFNYAIKTFYGFVKPEYLDFEINNKPIFKKAVKKLGPLGWYEMYAFEPAFALIGDAALTMDNLVKVDARIHMLLLRDLIDQPKIWSFNIEEDLKRIGTSLAEIAEKHRP